MSNDEKLFYGIGEVAEIVQVKPYVLRYWESEFKKLNPQKSFTGQRTYRVKDIQVALTIHKLLYDDKYTIAGAIQKLTELEANGQLVVFPADSAVAKPAEEAAPAKPTLLEAVKEFQSPKPEVASPVVAEAPTATPISIAIENAEASQTSKPKRDEKKVSDLKALLEATKKVLKKYNLS